MNITSNNVAHELKKTCVREINAYREVINAAAALVSNTALAGTPDVIC